MIKLKNGMSLNYVQKDSEFFDMTIGIGVGKIHEDDSNRGISHFIEHSVFNGNIKYSKDEMEDEFNKLGIMYNAGTGTNHTLYTLTALKEHYEKCIDLLTNLVLFPTFPDEYIEKERNIIKEELYQRKDNANIELLDFVDANIDDERLRHPVIGYIETINNISNEDMRLYHDKYYVSQNIIITVATNIDVDLLVNHFNDILPIRKSDNEVVPDIETNLYSTSNMRNTKIVKNNQNRLVYNIPIDKSDEPIAIFSNYILGNGTGSRLFNILREDMGLCYAVKSSALIESKSHYVSIYISYSDKYKTDEIIQEITNIITSLHEHISDEEYNMALNKFKTETLYYEEHKRNESWIDTIYHFVQGTKPIDILKNHKFNKTDVMNFMGKLSESRFNIGVCEKED